MGFLSDAIKGAAAASIGLVGANSYGAYEDKKATERANEQNIASAKEQMNFQERMSNTSYQRAMADMDKAGLNPMLAMNNGGASTPSGAMATVSPASSGQGRAMAKTMAEGLSAATQVNTMQNTSAQTASNVQLQSAKQAESQANIVQLKANTLKTKADAVKTLQDTKQSAQTFDDRKNILKTERQMKDVDADWQRTEKILNAADSAVGTVTNALNPFKGFLKPGDSGNSAKKPPSRPQRTHEKTEHYNGKGEHTGSTIKDFKYELY